MFTQQAPYILSTLAGGNEATSRQLVQAFANCNQALTHRGPVSLRGGVTNNQAGVLQPPHGGTSNYYFAGGDFVDGNTAVGGGTSFPSYQGGNYYGSPNVTYTPGNDSTQQGSPWSISYQNYYGVDAPSTYNNYITGADLYLSYPQLAGSNYYDNSQQFEFGPVSSVYNSNWSTQLGDTNSFDFSTRQGDLVNNYAGPTFQVAGDSYFDNSIHNRTTAQNQYVTYQTVEQTTVNDIRYGTGGDPAIAGPAGPPGVAGNPGLAGPRGAPGAVLFVPGIVQLPGARVEVDIGPPRIPPPPPPPPRIRFSYAPLTIPTSATFTINLPTSATLNPESCSITLNTTATTVTASLSGGSATSVVTGGSLEADAAPAPLRPVAIL